jgi:hypothetical protein
MPDLATNILTYGEKPDRPAHFAAIALTPVNWPLTIGVIVGAIAFVVARIWVRRWIINRWLDNGFSNRMVASLLVLTFFAPMLLVFLFAVVTNPETMVGLVLVMALIFAPMLALAGGLMDYAAQHGVKERMLKDREARRRVEATSSQ